MVKILEAKELTKEALLKIPGVQGVGVGASSQKTIIVYVESLTPQIQALVPKTIGGYPVQLIQSGIFRALSVVQEWPTGMETSRWKPTAHTAPLIFPETVRTIRQRPALGGMSIGNPDITAGTLGGVIGGLILSNNHVLANVSTVEHPRANIGDAILQPGKFDGGNMANDVIATLHNYVPLKETENNLVDAAWAKPLEPSFVSEEILDIGFINGLIEPSIGMEVQKSGRTTGVTTGSIIDINATITVNYGIAGDLTFTDQIVVSKMMDGGDSGSLGLDMNNKLWGLGFAGSPDLSVFNKISNVLAIAPPSVVGMNVIPLLALGAGAIWLFMTKH